VNCIRSTQRVARKKIPKELDFFKFYCDTRKKGAEVMRDTVIEKELYKFLRGIDADKCRVETKHPTVKWDAVWKNVSYRLLTTEEKSLWYAVVHDVFPTNSRLKDIVKSQTGLCEACGVPDTTVHRLTECGGEELWQYVRELLAGTIGLPVARVPREVCVKPENMSGRKMTELAAWVRGFYIYCLEGGNKRG